MADRSGPMAEAVSSTSLPIRQKASGRLQGRIAVVTGGSSSIGRAISLAYAKEGAKVVVADIRDTSRAPSETDIATHELIRKDGGEADFMKLDVTDLQNVEQVVADTVAKYGRLDMYVLPLKYWPESLLTDSGIRDG